LDDDVLNNVKGGNQQGQTVHDWIPSAASSSVMVASTSFVSSRAKTHQNHVRGVQVENEKAGDGMGMS